MAGVFTAVSHAPKRIRYWIRTAGLRAAFTWALCRLRMMMGAPPRTLTLRPRQVLHPVVARLGAASDMDVFRQIFLDEEYACLRDVHGLQLILDLGANVGYSSAYFLSCYPRATVLAVEPNPANYAICCQNLALYGDRARVIHGAVWSHRTQLRLAFDTFGDGRDWATQVREDPSGGSTGQVSAWDLPSLVRLAGHRQIDLLKCDIERSELEVFGPTSATWLPQVRNICIELHGPDCKQVFEESLKGFNYDLTTSGELAVCRNLRPQGDPMGCDQTLGTGLSN
jgi:FkbM family methyltransferase